MAVLRSGSDERRPGYRPHLADDDDGAVGAAAAVHAHDVGAGAEQVLRHVRRALAPHGPVAVVHLFVLEEHRRHHWQVRGRVARRDRGDRLLGEHHGLDREDVYPALGQRQGLLPKGSDVLPSLVSPSGLPTGRRLVGPTEP